MDNTTETTKEYFIIKIKQPYHEAVYWTDRVKAANISTDSKKAKKFKSEETAKIKAQQICEMNNAVVQIIRYIIQTSVRVTDLSVFIPKNNQRNEI